MSSTRTEEVSAEAQATLLPRMLGRHDTGTTGTVFVAIGSMHGNEPAGVVAISKVIEELERGQVPIAGAFIGLVGNRQAHRRGQRFLERDLNRKWYPVDLAALGDHALPDLHAENFEQRDLLATLLELEDESDHAMAVFDLHSTSAPGAPFVCMSDTLRNRRVAFAVQAPIILGLEETIDGTLLGYLSDRGHLGVAFEGGQHSHPDTVANMVAALWLALVAVGCLRKVDVPNLEEHERRLRRTRAGLPRIVEILHRHVVHPGDGFVMEPEFTSFQHVEADMLLATDATGEIRCPRDCRILMPLYQGMGEDGFFLAGDVRRIWLRISAAMRHLRLDRIVWLLPGVRRHESRPDHFTVDTNVARFLAVEIFHLLGFRKRQQEDDQLVFSRRVPDRRARKWHRRRRLNRGNPGELAS